MMKTTRREFCNITFRSTVGALMVTHFPSLIFSAEQENDYAFNPIREYLKTYVPPTGVLPKKGPVSYTFDIVGQRQNQKSLKSGAPVAGHVKITRSDRGKESVITVDETIDIHNNRASIVCNKKTGSIIRWTSSFASTKTPWPDMIKSEGSGVYDGKKILLKSAHVSDEISCPGPLVSEWTLLAFPELFARGMFNSFSYLRSMAFFYADQTMAPDGVISSVAKDKTLVAFVHTGTGTIPTHFVLDTENRPLFKTTFTTAHALVEIG